MRKKVKKWMALGRRWHHRRKGHLVIRQHIRDVQTVRGEFEFYWTRGFYCVQCKRGWPRYAR